MNVSVMGSHIQIMTNFCSFFEFYATRNRHLKLYKSQSVVFVQHSQLSHPMFNCVLEFEPQRDDNFPTIESVLHQYQATNRACIWYSWPNEHSQLIKNNLLSCNLFLASNLYGMSVELKQLENILEIPDGTEIRRVNNETDLDVFVNVFGQSFGLPLDLIDDYRSTLINDLTDTSPLHHYVAYVKGVPVATSAIFYSEGTAGVYSVGVLPNMRNQKLGLTMTLHALLTARDQGYKLAICHAAPESHKLCTQCGYIDRFEFLSYFHPIS